MFTVHLLYGFNSIRLVAVTAAGAQFGPPGHEANLLYLVGLAALVLGRVGASFGYRPCSIAAASHLAHFWSERLGKDEFLAHQASGRGGVLRVQLNGDRVLLGGQAVTVLRGELAE